MLACAAIALSVPLTECSQKVDARRTPESGYVKATDRAKIVPARARVAHADPRKPSDATSLAALLGEGWGKYTTTAGEDPVDRTPDGSAPPEPGAHRHLLTRFVHTADFQLADDESPDRVVALDEPVVTDAAYRPQESYACRTLDAVMHTINKIHEGAPLDVVLLGGDNVDNAQKNELRWVLSVLNGGAPLKCDSGSPDDPVPGPDNDGKDTFVPEGLTVPWLWVTGNHDVLAQGNFRTTPERSDEAAGDYSSGGTVVYSKTGFSVVQGTVTPDPERATMTRAELMARIMNDTGRSQPRGHGLGAYAAAHGKAFYTYDVAGTPIRFMVLDTSAETGGAEGVIHRADVDAFVVPELARAKAEGKYVILASHHAQDRITDGGNVGGSTQADALTADEWAKLLTASPQVILDMVGHAHGHRIRRLGSLPGGFWEMQCAAIADFPHEFRLVEIWDEDNGWLSVRSVAVDFMETSPVVAKARELAILDYETGWGGGEGPGTVADRNVILWQRKP